jgi:hypothetical protein
MLMWSNEEMSRLAAWFFEKGVEVVLGLVADGRAKCESLENKKRSGS